VLSLVSVALVEQLWWHVVDVSTNTLQVDLTTLFVVEYIVLRKQCVSSVVMEAICLCVPSIQLWVHGDEACELA